MAITKQKKEEISSRLSDVLQKSETVVFVNFHGLSVSEVTELRKTLREGGVGYYVAKKTLVKRALEASGVKGDLPLLEGELAVASGEDAVAPAKGVAEFAKTHKEHIKILGGVYAGAYMSVEQTISLAEIPPREVLYGQLVGMLNAPIQGLVGTLNAVPRSFVGALDQIAQAKA